MEVVTLPQKSIELMLLKANKVTLKKIKNKQQYLSVLERFERIFQAEDNTPEGDEADKLALLIREYDAMHCAVEVCQVSY